LIGPEQSERQFRAFLNQAAKVVGVDDAYIALPGGDGFHHFGVVGEYIRRKVGDPSAHDLLGFRLAVFGDHHRHQRLVIDFFRGAQTEPAFPFRVGQIFIGSQFVRFQLLRVVDEGARAHRETEPLIARIAQIAGDIAAQYLGVHRFEQAFLRGLPQIARVHGQQQIGWSIGALDFQALHQRAFLVGDELDLHPGFFGVGVE